MNGLAIVANFLISTFFSLVVMVLWLRIILRYFRVSHLNPLSQLVYQLSNPMLGFIERQVHSKATKLPRYDWVALSAIVVVEIIKFLLLGWVVYHTTVPPVLLLGLVLASLIVEPCNLLFYALLIRVILSWVRPDWERHPMASVLIMITEPLIRLGHKVVPDISGFDFAPFIVMIVLKVITLFISSQMPLI
jgi:YggT family protein